MTWQQGREVYILESVVSQRGVIPSYNGGYVTQSCKTYPNSYYNENSSFSSHMNMYLLIHAFTCSSIK